MKSENAELKAELKKLGEQLASLRAMPVSAKPVSRRAPNTALDRLQPVIDELLGQLERYGQDALAVSINVLVKLTGSNQLGITRAVEANADRIAHAHKTAGIHDTRSHNGDLIRELRRGYAGDLHPEHGDNWVKVKVDQLRAMAAPAKPTRRTVPAATKVRVVAGLGKVEAKPAAAQPEPKEPMPTKPAPAPVKRVRAKERRTPQTRRTRTTKPASEAAP